MSKLSQHGRDMLRVYDRSPKDLEGWAKVSTVVWPLLANIPSELIECQGDEKVGRQVRLTDKGKIVVEYLL